jgi:hypothetical protein
MSFWIALALFVVGGVCLVVAAGVAGGLILGERESRSLGNDKKDSSDDLGQSPTELRHQNRRLKTLLASFVWENRFITLNDEELVEHARRELGISREKMIEHE